MNILQKKFNVILFFATHYHELNYLKNSNNNIQNFQVLVELNNDQLIFSHRIVKGGSSKSYGIEAAKLAGVPREVIEKAKSVLNSLEENNKLKYDIN